MPPTLLALALAAGLATGASAWAQSPRVVAGGMDQAESLAGELVLSPRQFAQLAAVRNPEVRYARLGVDVAGNLSKSESALYEAVLFSSVRATDLTRQRAIDERLSSAAVLAVLDEESVVADYGVKQRLPTAGEVSLSYRMTRRTNNIISSVADRGGDNEWNGSLVIALKQPLLRGGGNQILETDRRIAALEHQVQWAQFRQQVLKSTADSLNLYWQLGRAQDARRMREESLRNVRRIEQDVMARIEAGRAPPVNQLEARSTVLARESEVTRADQAVREVESRLYTALGVSPAAQPNVRLKATLEGLPALPQSETLEVAMERALAMWPPFMVSRLRLEQGRLRLEFARDQTRPQLDFMASYSASGLAYDSGAARRLSTNDRYPEWMVGLSFEMPLGGKRAGGQFDAQAVRVAQNELELEAIRTSLGNDLAQRRDELAATLRLARQMQDDLQLRSKLVDAERERYNLGVGLLSQWLTRENEWLEARQRLTEVVMRAHMARAAWLFAQGTLLDEYDIALRNE